MRARRPRSAAAGAALLAALCSVSCKIDDRKLSSVDCPADGGCPSGSFSVAIASPSADTYTNGTLEFQVTVTGGTADSVELEANGVSLEQLSAPYSFSWDTGNVDEDEYTVIARATRGSQSVRSAPIQVFVDRTPPVILSHTPAASAKNVFIDDAISATFSEPLAPATATASSVTLSQGGANAASAVPLAAAVTLSEDGATLNIAPEAYVAAKTIRVALNASLTDRAGNALEPANWQFEVPTWQYLGKAGSNNAYYPRLAVDSNGVPHVAYSGGSGAGYLQRWTGSAWAQVGGELRGDLTAMGGVSPVSVVVPEPEAPVVAFGQTIDGVLKVYVRRWSGSNWVPVGSDLTDALAPELALGQGGALFLGLLQMTPSGSYSVHAAKWSGTAWQYLGGAANGATHVGTVSVALTVGAGDVAHVAWPSQTGAGNAVLVKRWTGSAWEQPTPPLRFDAAGSTSDPFLTADSKGVVHVAFCEYSTTTLSDHATRFQNGTFAALGASFNRSSDPTFGPTVPPIAVDATGRVVMVSKVLESGFSTFIVRRFDGTAWTTLGENLTAYPGVRRVERTATLALTPKGRAVVAFGQSDGTSEAVHVYRSNL